MAGPQYIHQQEKPEGCQDPITQAGAEEGSSSRMVGKGVLDVGPRTALSQREGNHCLPRDRLRREPPESNVPPPL